MRILMVISDNTYPPDIRVEKEIEALKSDGHDVGIVCLRIGTEKEFEYVGTVPVWRLSIPLRHLRFIGRALELAIFRHLTYRKIMNIAQDFHPDVIHVHDLPLALPAMKVASIIGARFVADMHEHYIGLLMDRGLKGPLGWLVRAILNHEERIVYTHADAVITVAEENRRRIEREFGIKGNVFVVSNTPDIGNLRSIIDGGNVKVKKEWDLCYVGMVSPERGLETLISALSQCRTKERLKVIIVGGGHKDTIEGLKAHIQGIHHNIVFTGQLPFKDAMRYISRSAYGIVPHKRTLLTEHTMPHKLFQYMYLSAPPIISDVAPLKRIVNAEKCGLVFRADDAEDLARTIEQAYEIYHYRREEWKSMASRGVRAVEERYNWSRDGSVLKQIYRSLGGRK